MKKVFLAAVAAVGILTGCCTQTDVVQSEVHGDYTQYVNPLMGTQSSFELSTGNTYPAIAMPWGMNFWTPRTESVMVGNTLILPTKSMVSNRLTNRARGSMTTVSSH